jgi:serine/threonine protein kinase
VGIEGPVLLKVLDGPLDPDLLRLVTEEVQALAAVGSPHVVRLLDAGQVGGRFFYATEHLPRGTLAEPEGELERSGILKVVADAARGAHALHEAGIPHGAISPDTIVLHDGGAKLAEPPLGRLLTPGMTVSAGSTVASVECIDPAVIRGDRPDRACDVWSLGVTLHRAISGRSAHGEELPDGNLTGAVRRILTARPAVANAVDPDVAAIVRACVALDPGDRPHTALAIAEWLEALL